MTDETLRNARTLIGERIAELQARIPRLAPPTISQKMDAIRANGRRIWHWPRSKASPITAPHHALMPGHGQSIRCCLEHMDEALEASDLRTPTAKTILAALALRLH